MYVYSKKFAKLLIGKVEFIVKLIEIYCSRNILTDEFLPNLTNV